MNTTFLFRLDNSRDNDLFFERYSARNETVAYSGTALKVGPGWIPDLIEVTMDTTDQRLKVRLIELEASEAVGKISARKYLPERSTDIIEGFKSYLGTIIAQCRQTADPRGSKFQRLIQFISESPSFEVRTAAALRNASSFIEDLPLIDQQPVIDEPGRIGSTGTQGAPRDIPFVFQGKKPFTRIEVNGITRVIRILDDVIQGRGISGGTLRSWRNFRVKPFNRAVEQAPGKYLELSRLLAEKTDRGMLLDCDLVCGELADMWGANKTYKLTADRIATAIMAFYPTALGFQALEPMQIVFDKARISLDQFRGSQA